MWENHWPMSGESLFKNTMKKPVISVVIACYNGQKYIKKCLDCVLKSNYVHYQVVIVDDASKDRTREILEKYQQKKNVKMCYLSNNKGPAYARNYGVKHSSGSYILFIDMDCEIEKNALKVIVQKFERNHSIGAIVMKLLTKNGGQIDNAGCFMSIFGYPYEVGAGENKNIFNKEQFVFGAKTAGLAVRRNVFNKIGGFDEDYMIHGEDIDLTWRMWLGGYKVLYLPTALGFHYQKGSFGKNTSHLIFYEGTKNNLSNLLKNMPIKILVWMLPLHIIFLILLTVKLCMEKRVKMAKEVLKGIFWNINNIRKTLHKRKQILNKANLDAVEKIMFGPIKINRVISKGWRWFRNA